MTEPLQTIRALVVDDDPVVLRLLTVFLKARRYAVEHCEDGEAALAYRPGARGWRSKAPDAQ